MLHIYFGEMDNVMYGPSWFRVNYEPEWLKDTFVQEMIEGVDRSKYMGGSVIDSPVFGPIPPERLSGGVQTLIMIYERPDLVFDATSCGNNCAKWLLEIGKKQDVRVNLHYLMHFEDMEPFEIFIENNAKLVKTAKEYIYAVVDYV